MWEYVYRLGTNDQFLATTRGLQQLKTTYRGWAHNGVYFVTVRTSVDGHRLLLEGFPWLQLITWYPVPWTSPAS